MTSIQESTLYIGNFTKRFHDFMKILFFFDEDPDISRYKTSFLILIFLAFLLIFV